MSSFILRKSIGIILLGGTLAVIDPTVRIRAIFAVIAGVVFIAAISFAKREELGAGNCPDGYLS